MDKLAYYKDDSGRLVIFKVPEVVFCSYKDRDKKSGHFTPDNCFDFIKNATKLATVMGIDACNDLDRWLDASLEYRKILQLMGWEEDMVYDPSDWGFTLQDFQLYPDKFEQVFKPISKYWERWISGLLVSQ